MAKNAEYVVGDEVTVSGVVTHVGTNGGNPEYTIAVNDKTVESPVSVPNPVHPAAFTNGPVELAEANQVTYDEAAKDSAEATKELEKKESDQVTGADSPEEIREKTVTPDPKKTPAGQGAKGTLPTQK